MTPNTSYKIFTGKHLGAILDELRCNTSEFFDNFMLDKAYIDSLLENKTPFEKDYFTEQLKTIKGFIELRDEGLLKNTIEKKKGKWCLIENKEESSINYFVKNSLIGETDKVCLSEHYRNLPAGLEGFVRDTYPGEENKEEIRYLVEFIFKSSENEETLWVDWIEVPIDVLQLTGRWLADEERYTTEGLDQLPQYLIDSLTEIEKKYKEFTD